MNCISAYVYMHEPWGSKGTPRMLDYVKSIDASISYYGRGDTVRLLPSTNTEKVCVLLFLASYVHAIIDCASPHLPISYHPQASLGTPMRADAEQYLLRTDQHADRTAARRVYRACGTCMCLYIYIYVHCVRTFFLPCLRFSLPCGVSGRSVGVQNDFGRRPSNP